MRHNSVGNIDGEVIGGITCASLRHEDQIPRTIVSRSRACGMRQGNKADRCRREKQKPFHDNFSRALSEWHASLTKRIDYMGVTLNHFKGPEWRAIAGILEQSYLSRSLWSPWITHPSPAE